MGQDPKVKGKNFLVIYSYTKNDKLDIVYVTIAIHMDDKVHYITYIKK